MPPIALPDQEGPATRPADARSVDGWLGDLGLTPIERAERDGVTSWDLVLDSRRRADVRLTLILDPSSVLLLWVHYAPPINDAFRVSYRQFLRWNDELPHVKFALSGDEDRPVLTSELDAGALSRDVVGVAITRLLGVCDLLLDESVRWLWPGAKRPPAMRRASRQAALFERFGDDLAELLAGDEGVAGAEPADRADEQATTHESSGNDRAGA